MTHNKQPKSSSFFKNVSLRIFFSIPISLKGLIVLPLLTRLYPLDLYGAWLQILLIGEFLSQILSLSLNTVIVRYLSSEKDQESFIRAVFTLTLSISLLFIAGSVVLDDWLSELLFGSRHMSLLLLTATVWIVIKTYLKIVFSVFCAREKIRQVSMREFFSVMWVIISICVASLFKLNLQKLVLLCAVGDTFLLILILFEINIPFPFISVSKSIGIVEKYLGYAAPLMLNNFLSWFTLSIDRFLVVHLLGLAAVGVYGISFQIASVLFALLQPISYVLFPRASRAWNDGAIVEMNRSFSQALSCTLMLSAPIIVGIFVTADGFIQILAGGVDYVAGTALIILLLLSRFSSVIYLNHLYVIHLVEKTYLLPLIFACSSIFNFILGYLLIPRFGLAGAALSRLLTLVLMAGTVTLIARRYVTFEINWNLVMRVGVASLLMGLSIFWMPMGTWYFLVLKVLIGVLVFLLYLILLRVATKENLMALKSQF